MEVHIMFYCSEKSWSLVTDNYYPDSVVKYTITEKSWSFVTDNYYPDSVVKYTITHEANGNWSSRYYVNDDNETVFDDSMLVRERKDESNLVKLLRDTVQYGSTDEIAKTILKIVSGMDMLMFSVVKHDPNQLFTGGCNKSYYSIQHIWWSDTLEVDKIRHGTPALATVETDEHENVKISIDTIYSYNVYHTALTNFLQGKSFDGFVIVDPHVVK